MNPQDLMSGLLSLLNWARRGRDKVPKPKPVCIVIVVLPNIQAKYISYVLINDLLPSPQELV